MKSIEYYTAKELLELQSAWEAHLKYGNDYEATCKMPKEYNPSIIEDEIERRLNHYDELIKEKTHGF